jgi:hypothetical protein
MKFIKLSLTLTKNGFKWYEYNWDVEEKKTIYKLSYTDDFGEKKVRHLNKEDLMKITNFLNPSTSIIEYNMFCTEDKVSEAKELLINKVSETAILFKKQIDELMPHIQKNF